MIQVLAAGGVVWREKDDNTEVLLIYRNNLWDLPKGKKERDESIEECARREVSEEVGIPPPEVKNFLNETYHEYKRHGNEYAKTTHWFSMITKMNGNFNPQTVEGIEAVKWTEIKKAKQMVGYQNLKEVLEAL